MGHGKRKKDRHRSLIPPRVSRAPGEQYPETIGNQGKADKHSDGVTTQPTIQANGGPPIKPTPDPDEKWYQSMQGWKPRLEIAAAIAVIVYAVITFLMWRDMRDNSKQDARAWVMPYEFKKTTNDAGQVLGANVFYKNTGRTPALRLHVFIDWKASEDQIPDMDSEGTNPPMWDMAPDSVGNSWPPIPPDAIKQIMDGRQGGFIFGTIWYEDIFGQRHWHQFCASIGPRFDFFQACTVHRKTSETEQ